MDSDNINNCSFCSCPPTKHRRVDPSCNDSQSKRTTATEHTTSSSAEKSFLLPYSSKIDQIEGKLKACEEKVAEAPSPENLENLEACKTVYEREYDYMVRGSIIRSRARWYEQGERNTKYFLNLENHNKKKSCVRRLLNSDGAEITDANNILDEVHTFYSDLYDEKTGIQTDTYCPFLVDSLTIPKLNDDMRKICDGQLTYSECFKVLSTFENNKTPGNDGLSKEFYLFFGQRLVICW